MGFLVLFMFAFCLIAPAQNQTSLNDKKTKTANESCDGALEIVPSKPMTFVRKRRPSTSETKRQLEAPAKDPNKDPKAEKRSPGARR